ncbi:hypothetical protein CXG81DRAFT_8919 [Caulochytrium protostelioides]|uniref:Nascent polypeptide-associated complex subunit beta n=1 Tax=Caulochytrium protostelioides TaxID=1555241 RepID=A0A4P9XED5_9FUNG|nr:hypothetical protein CXG81DRAFT_8919 [Caulochytrium protostelioides]|eukprot:RKP03893.1 hypothetical protein CXG81DRAFT_8919 [Caulochytrium protostelioides]
MNPEKLAQLQAAARTGGKGTPRRKIVKKPTSTAADDHKLVGVVQKHKVQTIPHVVEANLFRDDQHVVHFKAPKVQLSVKDHVVMLQGRSATKQITECFPEILPQLGPENMDVIRQIAAMYQRQMGAAAGDAKPQAAAPREEGIPELVGDFENVPDVE